MNPIRFAGLVLFAAAIACSDATGPGAGPDAKNPDLAAAREQWRAQDLHTYAFLLQRSCFCGNTHPLFVAVLSDTVAGVLDFETFESVDPKLGKTVDGLFDVIQSAIDANARLIRATYDPAKGFPTEIDYDGSAQIADDEIFYRASDVHPITPQVVNGNRIARDAALAIIPRPATPRRTGE